MATTTTKLYGETYLPDMLLGESKNISLPCPESDKATFDRISGINISKSSIVTTEEGGHEVKFLLTPTKRGIFPIICTFCTSSVEEGDQVFMQKYFLRVE